MLAIFVVDAFYCNNMKNCVIVTKFVLLPEIHCHNTIFCHNNKTVLAVINNTYIILYTTAIATYWFSKLELWICFYYFSANSTGLRMATPNRSGYRGSFFHKDF